MKLLTDKERKKLLQAVAERREVLETSVKAVCHGFAPALFLWGPPGLGKTHLLCTMLDGFLGARWKHHTTYTTPKGLMLALAESPDQVHLFEDCEAVLKISLAASILRAACGAPTDRERWVTYETAHEKLRVNVTGAIIIVTNDNLARRTGPLQGVASRFRPIRWDLTVGEIMASIEDIALEGYSKGKVTLSPKQCSMVALTLCRMVTREATEVPLDIRLFCEHALPTYAYCVQSGNKHWEDVLAAKITGLARSGLERQHERTLRLQQLADMICHETTEKAKRLDRWKAETGLGKSIFYRYATVKIRK